MSTTTARKTAARKTTTAKKVAPAKKSTPAKKAAETKVKKSDIPEEDRDWTYLAEKDPTDLHEDFAKWIEDKVGIDVDIKTLQAVCVLRMVYQRSSANKKRATYRPLAGEVVEQRSVHMIAAHQDAKAAIEKNAPKKAAAAKKTTPKPAAGKATTVRRTRAAKKA